VAEPYQEGKKKLWSMRSRVDGHDIYVPGEKSKGAAKKEMAVRVAQLAGRGRPKGFGPEKTTVGQALQDYGVQRLPFMKGARQEANRINRYLRAVGLHTLKVGKADPDQPSGTEALAEAGKPAVKKKVRCFKVLLVPPEPRVVHRGLVTHRRNQATSCSQQP
jgi:hypothetical protein